MAIANTPIYRQLFDFLCLVSIAISVAEASCSGDLMGYGVLDRCREPVEALAWGGASTGDHQHSWEVPMACTYDSSPKSKLVGSVALPNGMLALISTLRGK